MAGGLGRLCGGIRGLVDLIDEHHDAFAHDWWSTYGISPDSIGNQMSWRDAIGCARTLRADPASAIAAALEGWTNPISREALLLMDVFDLEHAVNSKRTPKPHPGRPWDTKGHQERHGDAAGRTNEEVMALVRPPV